MLSFYVFRQITWKDHYKSPLNNSRRMPFGRECNSLKYIKRQNNIKETAGYWNWEKVSESHLICRSWKSHVIWFPDYGGIKVAVWLEATKYHRKSYWKMVNERFLRALGNDSWLDNIEKPESSKLMQKCAWVSA